VKQKEFRRWLEARGATFVEGGRHTKVKLNGKTTTIPRHYSHDIDESLRKLVIKQLGIKE